MQCSRISPLFLTAIGCLLATISTGCQCTRLTDCYSNVIDDVSDHQGCMDDCYCACFDLTRIGYADWRACRCNRIWCRKCAEKEDCHCRPYSDPASAHIYEVEPQSEMQPESEPPVPAPEPAQLLPPATDLE